jgi:hypothetical protein
LTGRFGFALRGELELRGGFDAPARYFQGPRRFSVPGRRGGTRSPRKSAPSSSVADPFRPTGGREALGEVRSGPFP